MTDWAALAPAVLEALEREGLMPPRTRGAQRPDTLRFGTHGSLAVNLERGTWTDFETNESGGVIDLVQRQASTDWGGALRWLRAHGLLSPRGRQTSMKPRAEASAHVRNDPGVAIGRMSEMSEVGQTSRARARPDTPKPGRAGGGKRPTSLSLAKPDNRPAVILAASRPLSAAGDALAWRDGLLLEAKAAGPLPDLRWLPAQTAHTASERGTVRRPGDHVRGLCPAPGAAGWLVAPLWPLPVWLRAERRMWRSSPAVQLIAVDRTGRPVQHAGGGDKRTYGTLRPRSARGPRSVGGSVFSLPEDETAPCCWCALPGELPELLELHLVEGLADALALAATGLCSVAALTASTVADVARTAHELGADVTVWRDPDEAGRKGAHDAVRAVRCDVVTLSGDDPAALWQRGGSAAITEALETRWRTRT